MAKYSAFVRSAAAVGALTANECTAADGALGPADAAASSHVSPCSSASSASSTACVFRTIERTQRQLALVFIVINVSKRLPISCAIAATASETYPAVLSSAV